jgi:hypothetical protein
LVGRNVGDGVGRQGAGVELDWVHRCAVDVGCDAEVEVGLRAGDGGAALDDGVLGGGEASKISGPRESLILGGGYLFDKIDDGTPKLCVWDLHESFGEVER